MKKIVGAATMRAMDKAAIETYGIPGLILMENAGRAVVNEIAARFDSLAKLRVNIFAGKGNNGGDGFVVARHLFNRGAEPTVFLAAPAETITGDAAVNLAAFEKIGGRIKPFTDEKHIRNFKLKFMHTSVVVDALLGTGVSGAPRGFYNEIIDTMNGQGKLRIAVDLPSGLIADEGVVPGKVFNAHVTVTFGAPKACLYTYPAAARCGQVVVADISLPPAAVDDAEPLALVADRGDIERLLPRRRADGHKGTFGHALLACGSVGMGGAGSVAGRAALRMGAGLVTVALPRSLANAYLAAAPELMTLPLPETETGAVAAAGVDRFVEKAGSVTALMLGPGLGTDPATGRFVREVVTKTTLPLVLDADALNLMGTDDWLSTRNGPTVVTPHPGEMARLTGATVETIQADRIGAAKAYAVGRNVVVALKGAGTVIALPDGRCWLNPTGNDGLATAGSGDALAGMVASLLAQGLSPTDAAVAAVWLHGDAADRWVAEGHTSRSLVATDLLRLLTT
jgi:NAD(P)H-hydrate epimerase